MDLRCKLQSLLDEERYIQKKWVFFLYLVIVRTDLKASDVVMLWWDIRIENSKWWSWRRSLYQISHLIHGSKKRSALALVLQLADISGRVLLAQRGSYQQSMTFWYAYSDGISLSDMLMTYFRKLNAYNKYLVLSKQSSNGKTDFKRVHINILMHKWSIY